MKGECMMQGIKRKQRYRRVFAGILAAVILFTTMELPINSLTVKASKQLDLLEAPEVSQISKKVETLELSEEAEFLKKPEEVEEISEKVKILREVESSEKVKTLEETESLEKVKTLEETESLEKVKTLEETESSEKAKISEVASGTCGENAKWKLRSSGTLTISGKGAMKSFYTGEKNDKQPWEKYLSKIKKVIIKKGITTVGDFAFSDCTNLKSVTLPSTIERIGTDAFYGSKISTITIPAKVWQMKHSCFDNCYELKEIHFLGNLPSGLNGKGLASGIRIYCKKEYYKNFKVLFDYVENEVKVDSGDRKPSILTTGGKKVKLNETNIRLDKKTKTFQLTASAGKVTKWYSQDKGIANISSKGKVSASKKHGSTLVYAEITYHGYKTLISCHVTSMKNDTLVKNLPKKLKADFPVQCNTSMQSWDTGETTGYQPGKFVEKDKNNKYYQKILKLTKRLTKNCTTDREKAIAIQRWVSENISYGGFIGIGDQIEQIYQVYETRESHCQGYAYLTGLMLYMAGLPNGIVSANQSAHMWNIALLDGKWKMLDSTWDTFDFDYNDEEHGYIDMICFGEGNTILLIEDTSGVKLVGVGKHILQRENIKKVVVPDYVTSIFGMAMSRCENLKTVHIGQNVKKIEKSAFDTSATVTIKGYSSTAASRFAKKYGYNFVSLGIAAPSPVSVKNTKKGILITWHKIGGASGYMIYRKVGKGKYQSIKKITNKNKVTYTDSKVKKGKTYYYMVKTISGKKKSSGAKTKKIVYL